MQCVVSVATLRTLVETIFRSGPDPLPLSIPSGQTIDHSFPKSLRCHSCCPDLPCIRPSGPRTGEHPLRTLPPSFHCGPAQDAHLHRSPDATPETADPLSKKSSESITACPSSFGCAAAAIVAKGRECHGRSGAGNGLQRGSWADCECVLTLVIEAECPVIPLALGSSG